MISRVGAIAAAAALASSPARAENATHPAVPIIAALRVEPNACFDAASLAPALSHWLQRDTLDRRIEVEVAGQPRSPEGLVLRVRRDGEVVGEWRFAGLSAPCEEVRAAVGLAAALAIDATGLPPSGAEPAPTTEPPRAASAPVPPPQSQWPGVSASLDAVALFGVLPSPVGALAPGLGLRPLASFELRASGLFTRAGALAFDRRSVDVSLLAGRADACGALFASVVRARACAGLAAGRLLATTTGPMTSTSPAAPWGAALLRADLRFSMRPWIGFVLGADAVVPFAHPRFQVVTPGGGEVAGSAMPAAGGAVTIGPEITFR